MANARQFFLRCGLGQHVIHPGFSGNGRGGQRVVARHHHGADAQLAQLGKTLANTRLDHVLEVDGAQQFALGTDQQRSAAALGDLVDFPGQGRQQLAAFEADKRQH